jgi:O-antigen/teichoic acid export membrane protein
VFLRRLAGLVRTHGVNLATESGRSQERYRRIVLTSIAGIASRIFGSFVALITVPILFGYLGKEEYGLWSTVGSLTTWAVLFNLGITNSLVNVLSEAHGRSDRESATAHVSTAVTMLLIFTALLVALVLLLHTHLPWSWLLSTDSAFNTAMVNRAATASLFAFLLSIPFSVVPQIFAAYQILYINHILTSLSSIISLVLLLLLVRARATLPVILFSSLVPIAFVSLVGIAVLRWRELPWLRIHPKLFSWRSASRILTTSTPILAYQLGSLLVNQTQLLIIARRSSYSVVGDYAVLARVFFLAGAFIQITTSSFLPALREARDRGDHAWSQLAFKRLLLLRIVPAIVICIPFAIAGDKFVGIWLSQQIFFGRLTWLFVCVYIVVSLWISTYVDYLMIMDKIWVLVGLVLFNGLSVCGLTWFLAPRWGLLGAFLSYAAVTIMFFPWLLPLIGKKLVSPAQRTVAG